MIIKTCVLILLRNKTSFPRDLRYIELIIVLMFKLATRFSFYQGCPNFGVSGPHWKKKSRLGPHIKYIATGNHKTIS